VLVFDPGPLRARQEDPENLSRRCPVPSQKRERITVSSGREFSDFFVKRFVETVRFDGRFRPAVVFCPANEKILLLPC